MKSYQNIKILILEDNDGFATFLEILLKECGFSSIYLTKSYNEAVKVFEEYQPDVYLLDISLGNSAKTGINFAEKIRETQPIVPILYLTDNYSEDYYEKSRHTRPSSFMNKELSRFKLEHAIDLALLHIGNDVVHQNLQLLPAPVFVQSSFFFKIGDIYKAIPIQDVSYFFSDKKLNYAKVAQRNLPTSVQLRKLEREFYTSFLRVHKSYLVNIKYIEAINPSEATITVGGESLPIGYAYRKAFLERLPLLR